MFKLIVVTLAAFVAILQIFGDAARRPENQRAPSDGITLASLVGFAVEETTEAKAPLPGLSEAEAVQRALAAGQRARRAPVQETVEVATTATTAPEIAGEAGPTYWYVSGNRVNLRQGPGTGNAVVAQVTLGTEAEVLEARDGWMQIVTRDGAASGWISGQFLKEQKPG